MIVMSKIMYTCQEATQLIVEKADRKLSFSERLKLWFHVQLCDACKRFNIQNAWMDKQINKLGQRTHQLPEDCKTRITDALKKEEA